MCWPFWVANSSLTIKRAQFLARAAPTEELIAFARSTPGPIYVKCFPRPPVVAESAIELMVPGRIAEDLVWSDSEARRRNAATFCYAPAEQKALGHR